MDKLTRTGKSGTNTNRSEGTHALLKNGQTTLKESSAKNSTYCVRCPAPTPATGKSTNASTDPIRWPCIAARGRPPHAHLMISERANDGIERSWEQWFRRYNAKDPEKGGARKSMATRPKDWADHANQALARVGSRERITGATRDREGGGGPQSGV